MLELSNYGHLVWNSIPSLQVVAVVLANWLCVTFMNWNVCTTGVAMVTLCSRRAT